MSKPVLRRPLPTAVLVVLGLLVAMLGTMTQAGRAEASEPPDPTTRPSYQLPFVCGTLWRLDTYAADTHNPALDIVREPQNQTGGSPVLASAGGAVAETGFDGGAGNYVLINHGGYHYTVYIHLRDTPLVHAGQPVSTGTVIGYVGQTGDNASSDHLHYEQLFDGDHNGHLDWGEHFGEDVPAVFNGVTYTGAGRTWRNVQSLNSCGQTPPPPPPNPGRYDVDTFASAPVFATPTSTTRTGTLNAGTNYVYCKALGRTISDASGNHNHWWLKTDPDSGPANQYVSAYYLSRWGNDEAKDNNGVVIPDCPGQTPPPPGPAKYYVDTFASAPVFATPTSTTRTGTLNAGTNYVYCKVSGRTISDASGNHNRWWLKTDPDSGPANQYVSAYYLSRWGNDEAKDNNGVVIPDC